MTESRENVYRILLAICIVTPALALGAVHYNVFAWYLVPAGLLLAHHAMSYRRGKRRSIRLDLPSLLLLSMIGFTLLQLLPLPASLIEILSPAAYDLRTRALRPLGESAPSFIPLTLDATITVVELGKLFFYLAVYWTALSWTRKHGSEFILNLILAVGVLSAAVFLLHRLLMIDEVYGFYAPLHVGFKSAGLSAPLVNTNHMAGLLGLCTAVACGRAVTEWDRSQRVLILCLSGLLGGALLLTLSRGGIVSFIGGQCLFVLLLAMKKARAERGQVASHITWAPIGLALSLGLGLFVAQDAILGEFIGGDAKKLELFVEGLPLIGLFWAFGVGRGAFWVGFPLVSELPSKATFTHAENSIVQILADYGAPFGGFILLGFVYLAFRFLKHYPKRTEHIAAVVALVAFGIHNLVDFNMEVPGVAVIAVALLAVVQGTQHFPQAVKLPRRYVGTKTAALAAGAALFLAAYIGLVVADKQIDYEERHYRAAWAARESQPFQKEPLKEVLSRHPADWYIPFLVGVRNFYLEIGPPLPWLARAIELNPRAASAHLYAGRTFLKGGRLDQAMLEMRIAALYNPNLAGSVAKYLVANSPSFDTLSRIAVATEDKQLLWSAIAQQLATEGHEEESEKADLAILEMDPYSPRALGRHARRLASRGQFDEAIEHAKTLAMLPDYAAKGTKTHADILAGQGRYKDAVHILEDGLLQTPKDRELLRSLAQARQKAGDFDGALQVVASLRSLATDVRYRSDVAVFEAQLAAGAGRIQQALASYRRAHALNPSNKNILIRIVNLAEAHGDRKHALEALKKLETISPHDKTIKNRIDAIRRKELDRSSGQSI